jgi:transcriptional regulatory protein RtcR
MDDGIASAPSLVDHVIPASTAAHLDASTASNSRTCSKPAAVRSALSAAGRVLFDRSRERKKIVNDADRLRKYLARFDLEWGELRERFRQN